MAESMPEQPIPIFQHPKGTREDTSVGIVAGISILVVLVVFFVIFIMKMKREKKIQHYEDGHREKSSSLKYLELGLFKKKIFTYEELSEATDGFFGANFLGEGGFGPVYKGVLSDGVTVAVKCLNAGGGQGEREFRSEVEIISRLNHRHLVSLVGYCICPGHRMLVYPLMPNGTLEYHLHENSTKTLDWTQRRRVAIGTAKALAYLHEGAYPPVIHRDIKAANILLDENYEAMVSDFGLAKLTGEILNTQHSTRVMGTCGYVAPEYQSSRKVTEKADVYSYGVMLLELITGRQPINDEEDNLVDWARPILEKALDNGHFESLVDQRLEGDYDRIQMKKMMGCAALSIRKASNTRPKMSEIVRALEDDDASISAGMSRISSTSGIKQYYQGTQ